MDMDFANAGDFCDTKRSMEDEKFLNMLEAGVTRTAKGHFEMPLPFRDAPKQLMYSRKVSGRSQKAAAERSSIKKTTFNS